LLIEAFLALRAGEDQPPVSTAPWATAGPSGGASSCHTFLGHAFAGSIRSATWKKVDLAVNLDDVYAGRVRDGRSGTGSHE